MRKNASTESSKICLHSTATLHDSKIQLSSTVSVYSYVHVVARTSYCVSNNAHQHTTIFKIEYNSLHPCMLCTHSSLEMAEAHCYFSGSLLSTTYTSVLFLSVTHTYINTVTHILTKLWITTLNCLVQGKICLFHFHQNRYLVLGMNFMIQ